MFDESIKNTLIKDIFQLSALCGPSYREDEVIQYLLSRFRDMGLSPQLDHIGNLTVVFPSAKKGAPSLMVFAHSDEIGFVIRKIEKSGFLRVERIGGVHRNTLHGQTLQFISAQGEPVYGVIGVKSHHYTKEAEKGLSSPVEQLYVDVGAFSGEEAALMGLRVGTVGTFYALPRRQGDLIIGKAMDDRAACALLLTLAERLKSSPPHWNIILTISVQEEFNIRGIMPAVYTYRPDAALGIDITPACDTPELSSYSEVKLNGGPALTTMNFHGRGTLAGMLPDQKMLDGLIEAAGQEQVPVQYEVALGVLTETAYIGFSQSGGVPCAGLSLPTRYSHTPIETVSLNDILQTEALLGRFISNLSEKTKFGKSYLAE